MMWDENIIALARAEERVKQEARIAELEETVAQCYAEQRRVIDVLRSWTNPKKCQNRSTSQNIAILAIVKDIMEAMDR